MAGQLLQVRSLQSSSIPPHGLLRFSKMSFGLCKTPGTFQRTKDEILSPMKCQFSLMPLDDDIKLYSTEDEHISHGCTVLSLLCNQTPDKRNNRPVPGDWAYGARWKATDQIWVTTVHHSMAQESKDPSYFQQLHTSREMGSPLRSQCTVIQACHAHRRHPTLDPRPNVSIGQHIMTIEETQRRIDCIYICKQHCF